MAEIWGAAIGAAAGLWGASQQGKAAGQAANAQTGASDAANKQQWGMFQQTRADQEPFRQAGLAGLSEYMAMLGMPVQQIQANSFDPNQAYLQANPDVARDAYWGLNPMGHYNKFGKNEGRVWQTAPKTPTGGATSSITQADAFAKFRATPGYQFGLDEGNKSVQASAAARGGLNSGATLKSLMRFGRDYSDQQGYTPYMNKLASLAGIGQTATNQIGQYGQNAANTMGQNTINAGQARANGIYDKSNAWANFGNQVVQGVGQYMAGRNSGGGSSLGGMSTWGQGQPWYGNNYGNF
ncbi:hypothetical protein IP90_00938 [Luteimonas cucumeris]|uniref:DNA transfer protein n=1 Tax=Luteimonas cucumeris TaxID=985012 RepID=A0A562LAZ1_9GAMM|nr:hypothetical protein [Luteimonas cucumeris]TWI04800.1 hypothetical protein IP90_00938 [Luteimonas cucumeris]